MRAGGGENPYDAVEPKPEMKALDELADIFVAQCKKADLGFFKEFGDRYDGKAPQQLQLSGDADSPLTVEIVRFADADKPTE